MYKQPLSRAKDNDQFKITARLVADNPKDVTEVEKGGGSNTDIGQQLNCCTNDQMYILCNSTMKDRCVTADKDKGKSKGDDAGTLSHVNKEESNLAKHGQGGQKASTTSKNLARLGTTVTQQLGFRKVVQED